MKIFGILCLTCWFFLIIVALQREKEKRKEGGRQGGGEGRRGPASSQNLNLPYSSRISFEVKYYSFSFNVLNSFPLSSSTSSPSHFLEEMNAILLDRSAAKCWLSMSTVVSLVRDSVTVLPSHSRVGNKWGTVGWVPSMDPEHGSRSINGNPFVLSATHIPWVCKRSGGLWACPVNFQGLWSHLLVKC